MDLILKLNKIKIVKIIPRCFCYIGITGFFLIIEKIYNSVLQNLNMSNVHTNCAKQN